MCHTSAPPPSSTLTTLRALFMLACLVAIPAVALRGTALGGMLRRFLVEKLDKPAERSSARADLEDAPPFVSPATGLSSPTTSPPSAVTIRRPMRLGGCPAWRQRPARRTPLRGDRRRASRRHEPIIARPRHRWLPLGGGRKRAPLAAKSGRVHGPIAARRAIRWFRPSTWIGPAWVRRLPRRLPPWLPRRSKARRQRRMNSNPT